ncbi:MAG: STAS domain-containing protein [Victivallales bacterium]|nr:STAS domain-containing protein [Victivallales bacterium]
MEITQQQSDGIAIIALDGRLDAVTSADAEREFNSVLDSGREKLLIDLSHLEYISSAGLRILLVVAKRVQQKGGKIALNGLTTGVREVFEISGFSAIFKIFDRRDDALEFFKG